ncbi:hypothetical protein GCM10027073_35840 [Streptomyces chlorus]|uniref:Uncharacterized protein n=1 Tax=Streptomyces chlorus TaxID=887452 RepID=A0ABW1DZ86_9ACTN
MEADRDDMPMLDGEAGVLPAQAWTGADFDRAFAGAFDRTAWAGRPSLPLPGPAQ